MAECPLRPIGGTTCRVPLSHTPFSPRFSPPCRSGRSAAGPGRQGARGLQGQLLPLPRPGRRRRRRHELHSRPRQAHRPQEDHPRQARRVAAVSSKVADRQDAAARRAAAAQRRRLALLKQWIDAGAPGAAPPPESRPSSPRPMSPPLILADLEKLDRRSRRFVRYFSLARSVQRRPDRRRAADLSQRPGQAAQQPVLAPAHHAAAADRRQIAWSCASTCATSCGTPTCGTACWPSIPTASCPTPPSAAGRHGRHGDHDCRASAPTGSSPPPRGRRCITICLQMPTNLAELETAAARGCRGGHPAGARRPCRLHRLRHLRKNNRILERHDAIHGAYWRTYDFEAIPQNLVDRGNLLPDRRNLFAYPLGPGSTDNTFQHAGRRGDLQPAQRPARLHARQRQQRALGQGDDRHRQRSQAAGPGRRGRRLVHVVPLPRHQSQGRPDPRSRR